MGGADDILYMCQTECGLLRTLPMRRCEPGADQALGSALQFRFPVPTEDPMAEKNRKKTYLILIVILLVVLLITYM